MKLTMLRLGAAALALALVPAAASGIPDMPVRALGSAPRIALASWYHEGRWNADGSRFRPDGLTAAHRTLPFGTRLRVTRGNRSVVVVVRDRGPARWTHRDLDLSRGAARELRMLGAGVARVTVQIDRSPRG